MAILCAAAVTGASLTQAQRPAPTTTTPRPHQREMTDDERVHAERVANEAWSKMNARDKLQLMRLHRALIEMPKGERKFIHERIELFLNMSPAERARLEQNRKRWETMTPEEKEKARAAYRNRRQELEQSWQREHPGEPFPGPGSRRGPHPAPPPSQDGPGPESSQPKPQ